MSKQNNKIANKISSEIDNKADSKADSKVDNKVYTVEGKPIDILELPFMGEEQPLHIDKQRAVQATLSNGFIPLKVDGSYIDIKSMEVLKEKEAAINKDMSTPTLFIDINVYARIFHVLHRAKEITGNECAGLFIYKKLNSGSPHYLVTDFILTGQEASSGAVELDDIDMSKYIKYIEDTYLADIKEACEINNTLYTGNILDYIGHWHSHGNMGTFWSATDTKQQEDRTQLGFNALGRFYIVFNLKGDIHSSYVQYSPFFHRKDNINIGLYIGKGYSFNEDDRNHLDELIDTLIISKRYNYTSNSKRGTAYSDIYNSYYGRAYNNPVFNNLYTK